VNHAGHCSLRFEHRAIAPTAVSFAELARVDHGGFEAGCADAPPSFSQAVTTSASRCARRSGAFGAAADAGPPGLRQGGLNQPSRRCQPGSTVSFLMVHLLSRPCAGARSGSVCGSVFQANCGPTDRLCGSVPCGTPRHACGSALRCVGRPTIAARIRTLLRPHAHALESSRTGGRDARDEALCARRRTRASDGNSLVQLELKHA
jgi:hypothetical protein